MTGEALNLGGRTGLSLEWSPQQIYRDRSWSKHQNRMEFRGSSGQWARPWRSGAGTDWSWASWPQTGSHSILPAAMKTGWPLPSVSWSLRSCFNKSKPLGFSYPAQVTGVGDTQTRSWMWTHFEIHEVICWSLWYYLDGCSLWFSPGILFFTSIY